MRKNKRSPVVFVKKPTFVATQVALAVMAQFAYAQQAPIQTAERVERVEITGSRIPTVEAEGPSPVTVMSAQEIKLDGLQKTEDLLNGLPQVFASQGSNTSNGASGTAQVDLRHQGPTRTLVLFNGRRMPPGSPDSGTPSNYAADLNQIPAALIQRVEILTGGASAVYGSDAIGGVVNFIMNDRFEGLQVDLNHSFYNHQQQNPNGIADIIAGRALTNSRFQVPGNVNDGPVNGVSVILGKNFADNKGNGTLFFGYKKEEAVTEAARDFSACSLNPGDAFNAPGVGCGGSSTSATGRFRGTGQASRFTLDQGTNAPRVFRNATDLFNFAPYNYFRRPSEQFNAAAFAHLDIAQSVRAYGEFNMHDYHTDAVIAPSGVFGQVVTLFDANPLLTPAWKTALGIPTGTTGNTVTVQRRNVEGGGRDDDLRFTSYRGVVGLKGDLSKAWNYDVFLQSGKVLEQRVYRNDFSTVRTFRALDVVAGPGGVPTCRSVIDGTDPNCVPWNIWSVGGVTQAALNYLQTPGVQNGRTEQNIVGGTLQADLGQYGWRMPGARNGLALALGAERRKEKLNLDTDVEFSTFDLAGQGGPIIGINNKSLGVEEVYGELRVPLVENKPLAQALSVTGSARRSNYTTNISTTTWGLGLEYAPIKPARFRGSVQHAVRAPNIIELYQANGTNLFEMGQDPCDLAATNRATAAQCARSGLSAAQYASAGIASGLTNPAGQYNFIQGGNAALTPETANTLTLGVVLTPVRNLTATVDYWRIKIDQVINNPDPSILINQCIFAGQFCNLVQRDPTNGTLWLPGGSITATLQNLSRTDTSGLDIGASYTGRMGALGGYGLLFNGSYLMKNEQEPFPGLGTFDCAGYYGGATSCGSPNPKWRHKLRGTWATPWNLDLALTWRHIDSVDHFGLNPSPLLNSVSLGNGPVPATDAHLGARDYFDIAASWQINKTFALRGGVNNVFDQDPPIVSSTAAGPSVFGNGNAFPQTYDALGRLIFMNLTMKF